MPTSTSVSETGILIRWPFLNSVPYLEYGSGSRLSKTRVISYELFTKYKEMLSFRRLGFPIHGAGGAEIILRIQCRNLNYLLNKYLLYLSQIGGCQDE